MTFAIFIVLAAFGGFCLAFYLHHKKKTKEVFVCPLKANCDTVVHSEYSKFFEIPVEFIGMLYYATVAIGYLIMMAVPSFAAGTISLLFLLLTTAAFLFSMYLTFIQAFALKQWCSWCLISAAICTGIFVLVISHVDSGFLSLLAAEHTTLTIVHLVGVALGVGGATVADVLFFKFLKDFRISESESEVLRTLSQVIWFGLAILLVSGIGLWLPEAAELAASSKFLTKVVVVAVILVNAVFLNLVVAPKMVHISFGEKHEHEIGELHYLRRLAFALGAISLPSWYAALVLGALPVVPYSFGLLLTAYASILVVAILVSQGIERVIVHRARKEL